MKTRLEKSIEYLTNYCDKQGCSKCRLYSDKLDGCLFQCSSPHTWMEHYKEMETTYARKKTD